MDLIEFKNLPNTDTPINAENLNNNFNELNTKIDELNEKTIYSIEEKVIGTWKNNKPLYRKCVQFETFPSGSNWHRFYFDELGLINVEDIYIANGSYLIWEDANHDQYVKDVSANNYYVLKRSNVNHRFDISENPDFTTTAFIVFEYTKTTD